VMQSQAQQKVSASEANVILSSEPLWARESAPSNQGLRDKGLRDELQNAVTSTLLCAVTLMHACVCAQFNLLWLSV
jgi:hypothetical protein